MPSRILRTSPQATTRPLPEAPIPFTTPRLATSTLQASPWVWALHSLCQRQKALFPPGTEPIRMLLAMASTGIIRWLRFSITQIPLALRSSNTITTITKLSPHTTFPSIRHNTTTSHRMKRQKWKRPCLLISTCKNTHQLHPLVQHPLTQQCGRLRCQLLLTSTY
jgi:hypothetical protein